MQSKPLSSNVTPQATLKTGGSCVPYASLLGSLAGLTLSIFAAAGTLGVVSAARADVTPHGAMLRFPDVSATQIVFSYANDLWIVPKTGGVALPLSSPAGQETFPRFNADGTSIAFVGNYEGNRDIYTIPVAGGAATRVTFHAGAESLSDWAGPNYHGGDKLLYLTNGFAGLGRQTQLFDISSSGGPGKKLPVPYAGFGMVSPDGNLLAYSPHSTDNRTWKRYRGGMATDLWLYNLKDNSARQITDWEGNDTLPMWIPGGDGSVVYYLSDQGPEHRMNVWSYSIKDGIRTQITAHTDNDVRWPGIGPGAAGEGELVFQLGSQLRLLNLGTKQETVVKVTIPGDRPKLRSRRVDAAKQIETASISPNGKRVVIEGRGDLFSAPAKEGAVRSITRTDAIFERSPAYSPDGNWIAYFSDEGGEWELWVRPADVRAPQAPKDDEKSKPDGAAGDKKEEPSKDDAKPGAKPDEKTDDKADAKADDKADDKTDVTKPEVTKRDQALAHLKLQPRKLTSLGAGFKQNAAWSPDSKHIVFSDQYGQLSMVTLEDGALKQIDKDPWGNPNVVSWSHDSNWITFSRGEDDKVASNNIIFIYNVKTGDKTAVTSPMFSSSLPAFDRKGEWLYFISSRIINNPTYSDIDSTFAYNDTQAIYAVPLRTDVKNPWAPKSDEEEWKAPEKKDEKKDDKKEDKKDDDKDGKKEGEPAKGESKPDADKKPGSEQKSDDAASDDGISGTWTGTVSGNAEGMPAGGVPVTLTLTLSKEGTLSGNIQTIMGGGALSDTSYDKATGNVTFNIPINKQVVGVKGTIKGEEFEGTWTMGQAGGTIKVKRTAKASDGSKSTGDAAKDAKDGKDSKDAAKEVKITLDGFERRAIQLPITPGSFGGLLVNGDGKLLFFRNSSRNSADVSGLKIFDINDDEKKEALVTSGGGSFDLSADGKKMVVVRGNNVSVVDASAGGKSTSVPTAGMVVTIDPRDEWKQILVDSWRQFRDYFYEPTMHGVDWPKVRDHYLAMIDDASSREDVAYIQAELVSELNIGHAYITSPGETEDSVPPVNVGMLGADYELVKSDAGTAYRITKIYSGADWDADARGPLTKLGVDVKEGEFVLAVNGQPIDTSRDIYAAFLGTAGNVVSLTVGPNPLLDAQAREVLITPVATESDLRYRAWIEAKRQYVDKKSDGKVGYIYVPNTGVDGQSDLWRQFTGQRGRAALIIDDRWNGGGQIPTRFIEMLARKPINFWARRNGNDWPWPPDAHFGPKAMLINGLAGSGGDMFPWLFKHEKIGKTFGTRTWGGLVGISGYPSLIDGGRVAVPSFGFYELDGTWGVEGHGVDPDVEVLDDPSKMLNDADPQIDAAVAHLLDEVKRNGFTPPARPASPNRSRMGIDPKDK
jgi:tricorn protease-like protein/C-terminal processing protease CtpA/Prc